MNQEEREAFFKEETVSLKRIPRRARIFPPQGNHKRSLVGECWLYIGESDISYNLFKDEIIQEDDNGVWIRLWMDHKLLTENPIYITMDKYKKIYPVQELFPYPTNELEATAILKSYFQKQERSTTIENNKKM